MGSSEEDEWEKLNFDSLRVNQQQPDPKYVAPAQSYDSYRPSPPIPVYDENVIDQALLDALDNPRERMTLLRFEQVFYGFVKSRDAFMEFPPVQNSYQRLIAYRIAQRFRLEHSFTEGYYDTGEPRISFYKTPHTYLPGLLLYDVSKQQAAAAAAAKPASAAPIKMMKRAPKKAGSTQASAAAAPVVTCAEKERQYAEARARIFGNETTATPPPTPSAGPPAPKASPASPASDLRKGHISSAAATAAISAVPTTERHGNTTPSPPLVADDTIPATSKGKKVNLDNWKGKKVIMRDKAAEMYDPDFTRHSAPMMATAPPPSAYNYYPPDYSYNQQYYPCEPQGGIYYPPQPPRAAPAPSSTAPDYNADFPPLA